VTNMYSTLSGPRVSYKLTPTLPYACRARSITCHSGLNKNSRHQSRPPIISFYTNRLPLQIPAVCSSSPTFHSSPLRRNTSSALPTLRRRTSISAYVLHTKCFASVPSGRTGRTPVNGSERALYSPDSKMSTRVRMGAGLANGWGLFSVMSSGQIARRAM
jgi:hypothetical protein